MLAIKKNRAMKLYFLIYLFSNYGCCDSLSDHGTKTFFRRCPGVMIQCEPSYRGCLKYCSSCYLNGQRSYNPMKNFLTFPVPNYYHYYVRWRICQKSVLVMSIRSFHRVRERKTTCGNCRRDGLNYRDYFCLKICVHYHRL